jgi:hypothetical protein
MLLEDVLLSLTMKYCCAYASVNVRILDMNNKKGMQKCRMNQDANTHPIVYVRIREIDFLMGKSVSVCICLCQRLL